MIILSHVDDDDDDDDDDDNDDDDCGGNYNFSHDFDDLCLCCFR